MESESSRQGASVLRRLPAVVLALVVVGSIGVIPVSAAAVAAGSAALNWNGLARSASLSGLEPVTGIDGFSRERVSLPQALHGPVEMVVVLEGNSLAEEQAQRIADGRPALDGAGQRAYAASLREAQAGIKASLQAAGVRIIHEYRIVLNGFDVVADRAVLAQALSLPGVSHLEAVHLATPALDNSVPFVLGGKTNDEIGADGTGITVAIIDSGIDYTHAAFGGSGDPADYEENNRTIIEEGTFPTAKVVGGMDLVGEFYDARGFHPMLRPNCTAMPVPDPDPLDHNGHGTHVAGIAAGMPFDSFPQGVAPGASLFAVKLFSGCALDGTASTSSANVVAAIEVAADPNGDGDTSDHVDVINMSLGGGYGRDSEITAVASNAAVAVGVIVVASAGNAGNLPYITGAPAAATNAISVAAGNDPGVVLQLAGVTGSNNSAADGDFESLPAAFGPALDETGVLGGATAFVGTACNPITTDLAGMIPLIARGTCTFVTKVRNAQNANATAVVVYNNVVGAEPIVMGDDGTGEDIEIASVMVGNADGLKIRANIIEGTAFELDPDNQLSIPNRLQGFTSRGPRFGDSILKPDLTAPGGSVLSAAVGSGNGGVELSGTSMSSPHVAGAAAILRALHPDWSVAEIKSALMNTATDTERGGVPYPIALQGAGRMRIDAAAMTESVVVPGSLSFSVKEGARDPVVAYPMALQVRNKEGPTKTFDVTSAFGTPGQDDGSITLLHPSSITVRSGRTAALAFAVEVDFRLIPTGFVERDGFLTLTERGGDDVLRVPFHILPVARSSATTTHHGAEDGSLTVGNRGVAGTLVDVYQFGVRDSNENLIREARGLPNDPDDWFDISDTGAHVFDDEDLGRILEFAVVTHGLRSIANMMVTDIWIDVDEDGIPDYLVEVADIGLFTTGSFDPTGRMASAVFELTTGDGFLEFIVGNPRNTAVQTAPIILADLNELGAGAGAPTIDPTNQTFRYFVNTIDLETGSVDATRASRFNAINPVVDASPQFLALPAGERTTIEVLGGGGELLILYYNNMAGGAQSQVVHVGEDRNG